MKNFSVLISLLFIAGCGPSQLKRNFEEADKFVSENPNNPAGYLARATFSVGLNDCVSAEADLDKVISMEPMAAKAYFLKGVCKNKQNDYENALMDLNKAIELQPNVGSYYCERSKSYAFTDNIDLALNDAKMSVQLGSKMCADAVDKLQDYYNKQQKESKAAVKQAVKENQQQIEQFKNQINNNQIQGMQIAR